MACLARYPSPFKPCLRKIPRDASSARGHPRGKHFCINELYSSSTDFDLPRLYCSSMCRQKDQGSFSPQVNPDHGSVHITSQLPPALSPHVRPTNTISLSPRNSGQPRATSNGTSSGSSSVNSSPLHSPQTNPSDLDSPQKGLFDLPPPAYPVTQFGAPPSAVPMKIPPLLPRASPIFGAIGTPGSQGSTIYPHGASIDTLRFGRRPGAVNSVTSPNALIPRCACGLPANHRTRATSKDRAEVVDSGFSRLSLGPSVMVREEPISRSLRIVSDSAIPPFTLSPKGTPQTITATLNHSGPFHTEQCSPVAPNNVLSRSRSDPIPPSPKIGKRTIAPVPVVSTIIPTRRQSSHEPERRTNVLEISNMDSPRRGRSRERQEHHGDDGDCPPAILNHPPEREAAPSRSRTRRDSRRRSGERSRSRQRERIRDLDMSRDREHDGQRSRVSHEGPQILPSWSRPDPIADRVVAPSMKGQSNDDKKKYARDEDERKRQELRRATNQFGQVFGVAAG